jgi:hypothetical protein
VLKTFPYKKVAQTSDEAKKMMRLKLKTYMKADFENLTPYIKSHFRP